MICPHCNSEIPDGSGFCSVCGKSTAPKPTLPEELIGKTHKLSSATQQTFAIGNGRIRSHVTFTEDKLTFDVFPKKYLTMTELAYDNISSITYIKKMNLFHKVDCITIIGIPFAFLFGINTIMTINTKDGRNIVLYENFKSRAEAFIKDIETIIRLYK